MSPLAAMAIAVLLTSVALATLANLATRIRPRVNPLSSPSCDRCGKSTEKPWLWSQPKRPWHCAPCDGEVAFMRFEVLLDAQRNAIRRSSSGF
jgi:hypothetical protein